MCTAKRVGTIAVEKSCALKFGTVWYKLEHIDH
jgi:hypothetical protein